MTELDVEVLDTADLWFAPGDPVRAASGIARWGDGWLVAQDDAVDAAWWRPAQGTIERVRLLPPRRGQVVFSERAGTKHLKPDLEAACEVQVDGRPGVLLLGSGSLPARTHGALLRETGSGPAVATADLRPVYARVREVLGLAPEDLNLEGACVVEGVLRWFQRGLATADVPSGSVDVDLAAVLAAVTTGHDATSIAVSAPVRHDLGSIDGMALGITDAVTLPGQRVLVSASAEDTPDAVADGPVAGSALALLTPAGGNAPATALAGALARCKVEGLACLRADATSADVLAVVDQDDPAIPSRAAWIRVRW